MLPTLLEKSLERGWRVVVQASSEERVEALDAHLWTFRDDSFLPHGTWREAEAREQPILLTINDDNPNGAAVRFLLDGAPVPTDAAGYQRIVLIFDGEDADAVAAARERWSEAKAQRLRGDLLAAGRARPLATPGMSCRPRAVHATKKPRVLPGAFRVADRSISISPPRSRTS